MLSYDIYKNLKLVHTPLKVYRSNRKPASYRFALESMVCSSTAALVSAPDLLEQNSMRATVLWFLCFCRVTGVLKKLREC